ncbi:MAG: glycosyltransferase family 2 protein [Acidobacteriia bacterium]|nr:glycosyltransferase family 2 protein [Terriglobia bacterium]
MNPMQLDQTSGPDAEKSPRVVVSILNWNGWQDTLECLESVRRLDYPNYLTVVVDNGSRDDSAEKIKAWAHENLGAGHVLADYTQEIALQGGDPQTEEALESVPSPGRLVLIRNKENLGFSGGNNVAIHYALTGEHPADFVFLLNNDATVETECVRHLVSTSQAAAAGIVGAVVAAKGDPEGACGGPFSFIRQFFCLLVSPQLRSVEKGNGYWRSDWVYGAGMLVRREVLETVFRSSGEYLRGGLFMYWDEVPLCFAARKAGYISVFAGEAVINHSSGTSSRGSSLRHYYVERNKLYLAKEMLPLYWKPLFYLSELFVTLARISKNVIAGRPRVNRAILWGVIDAFRGVRGKWKRHDKEAAQGGAP